MCIHYDEIAIDLTVTVVGIPRNGMMDSMLDKSEVGSIITL